MGTMNFGDGAVAGHHQPPHPARRQPGSLFDARPRSDGHLRRYVKAADTVLDETVLDAIDELVPPGTNFVERDAGAVVPSFEYANCVGGNRR